MKEHKDFETKMSYIQRIKDEKKDKRQTDKKVKTLEKQELELIERVKKTQQMYKQIKPKKDESMISSGGHTTMLKDWSINQGGGLSSKGVSGR